MIVHRKKSDRRVDSRGSFFVFYREMYNSRRSFLELTPNLSFDLTLNRAEHVVGGAHALCG